jgi:hypothetical protein
MGELKMNAISLALVAIGLALMSSGAWAGCNSCNYTYKGPSQADLYNRWNTQQQLDSLGDSMRFHEQQNYQRQMDQQQQYLNDSE